MTFDQFANQGGTAAWDPESAAATKKAAEKIFNSGESDDATTSQDSVGTDGDEDSPKQDPNQPGEVPDPDLTLDP